MYKIIVLVSLAFLANSAHPANAANAPQRWGEPHGIPTYDQTTDLGRAMTICSQFIIHVPVLYPHTEVTAYHYDDAHWQRCDAIHAKWQASVDAPGASARKAQSAQDEKLLDTLAK